MSTATPLQPALRSYRGSLTDPTRWATWQPRAGDILVCTPPKCGTTWTQTILSMLVHGGPTLPEPVPVLSPWIDADMGVPVDEVAAALERQPNRRVVKTHTPADGFPVWEGVTVVAVYRHPLDVFFSLRRHIANRSGVDGDHAMLLPVAESLTHFLDGEADTDDFDRDNLATITLHFAETALSGRLPGLHLFHYADMVADPPSAVARLAEAAGIGADAALIASVAEATSFGAMKSRAADYVPVAGTGFWKSDAAFFDSGSSRKWEGQLSEAELALYERRIRDQVSDPRARAWLESGG